MAALTPDEVRDMLLAVAKRITENEEMLCQADREIGDGDHGVGMAKGFSAAVEVLESERFEGVYQPFAAVGRTLIKTMGGASGIIFGLLFFAGTKNQEERALLDVPDLAGLFERAMQEIIVKGGAQVGDKTMLDALDPVVRSLKDDAAKGTAMLNALKNAAQAAESGKEESKKHIARFGKAKTLGERAIGFPDAGAVSLALIMKTISEWAEANL